MRSTPAESLEGVDLGNGWKVIEKISRRPHSTGGIFSVGYKVQNVAGKEAFLKALDFSHAFKDPDPPSALRRLTELYIFERDLLAKCRDKRLSRIMVPLEDGKVLISGFGDFGLVLYLIFELASGDIRDVLQDFPKLDLLWSLNSLHNVAVGLKQLHQLDVAHQDVKPSNVLVVEMLGSKVSDLGNACDRNQQSLNDSYLIPGDPGYAPLDLYYQASGIDGFERRFLIDLYLFGSLFFFHFSGISALHGLQSKLQTSSIKNNSFKEDLPYFQHAFEESLNDLRAEVEKVAGGLTDHIMLMVKQLCEPDPSRRGDPGWKDSVVPPYDLQRFISKLDWLCKKVEIGLR